MKLASTLKVSEVSPQGRDAVLISLVPEDDVALDRSFKPGQYLTVAATIAGTEHWRSYSIISEPGDNRSIGILVRRVEGGLVSNWICDHVAIGQPMRVLPPAGRFTLARADRSVLLFAGGSGIAPIFALARQALAERAPKVGLFYANRDHASLMLKQHLDELSKRSDGRLQIRFWFDGDEGLPNEGVFLAVADAFGEADAYLCGPEAFMRGVRLALNRTGAGRWDVHQESFTAAADSRTEGAVDGPVSSLTVQIKGQVHELDVAIGQTLLSAMLDAGLRVPHSCKAGECASCMCRLLEGDVERLENSVLDEDDVAQGWILACSTRPIGSRVSVSFI